MKVPWIPHGQGYEVARGNRIDRVMKLPWGTLKVPWISRWPQHWIHRVVCWCSTSTCYPAPCWWRPPPVWSATAYSSNKLWLVSQQAFISEGYCAVHHSWMYPVGMITPSWNLRTMHVVISLSGKLPVSLFMSWKRCETVCAGCVCVWNRALAPQACGCEYSDFECVEPCPLDLWGCDTVFTGPMSLCNGRLRNSLCPWRCEDVVVCPYWTHDWMQLGGLGSQAHEIVHVGPVCIA